MTGSQGGLETLKKIPWFDIPRIDGSCLLPPITSTSTLPGEMVPLVFQDCME
jgi:hypothetical protein